MKEVQLLLRRPIVLSFNYAKVKPKGQ